MDKNNNDLTRTVHWLSEACHKSIRRICSEIGLDPTHLCHAMHNRRSLTTAQTLQLEKYIFDNTGKQVVLSKKLNSVSFVR